MTNKNLPLKPPRKGQTRMRCPRCKRSTTQIVNPKTQQVEQHCARCNTSYTFATYD